MKNKEETHNCGKISINNSKEKKKAKCQSLKWTSIIFMIEDDLPD